MTTLQNQAEQIMLTEEEKGYAARFLESIGSDSTEFRTASGHKIPEGLNRLVHTFITAAAEGRPITVSTMPQELTTTSAASLLGVSRPTLMKWIRSGRINATKVGSHHRLIATEVLDLREKLKEEQRRTVFALMDLEDELESEG